MTDPVISLCAGTVLPIGPAATIDLAAATGYRHVGLRLDPSAPPAGGWSALRKRADDQGVSVFDVEVVRLGVTADRDIAALVDAAAVLGASWVLAVSQQQDRTLTVPSLAAMVHRCVDAGDRLGTALEFMAFTSVTTLAEALPIARDTGAAVVIDALHVYRNGQGPADVARLMQGADAPPCYLQLCDTASTVPTSAMSFDDLADEARHHRLVPGTGFLPLRELIAALPAGTPLAAEVQSDELLAAVGPHELAERCLTAVEALLHP